MFAINTVSIPLVEINAYCSIGEVPFSIQTRWTLPWSSIIPVTSIGFDVFRFESSAWVAASSVVLFAVKFLLWSGSREMLARDIEGAKREVTSIAIINTDI